MTITSHRAAVLKVAANAVIVHTRRPRAGSPLRRRLLCAGLVALLLLPAGTAFAATTPIAPPAPRPVPRPVLIQPSSAARFQQVVRQQQVQDQLQKSQVEARNRQSVSDNSRLPHANNPQLQRQIDQADAAQQNIERAQQQDIINRYQATPPPLGRVVVPQTPPAKPAGGG